MIVALCRKKGRTTASEPMRTARICFATFHVISFISLDYDLSGRETGYDVLKYMVEHGNHVKHINIHSDHSIGVPKMEAYVREHFPNAELTFNPL